ncbi:response regulator transcription factor [Actinomycetospora termitidis]|uniref:Sensory transduction protein RegX3 n=1 Tax=Actinomycetospora termitidis TaxID=3053470 RepID=A0ABT7M875_9PSEU|nr:response regulator transcription factor [Actinomycetospora sp. Odt1-22]MDL5156389.1 response regulator transcription factor [Actinomycetospora sp. Odt1-22]
MRILLVEDDDRVAAALRTALARQQIEVARLATGRDVVSHLAGIDVVLLDLGLPDVDGIEVCRRIRAAGDTPVIVVSARGEVDDRILGLHSGADDYLVKPYDAGELLARVHTVLRRRRPEPADDVVDLGAGLVVDLARREVRDDGAGRSPVALSRKEFAVLALLARADGAVCTRERIVAEVWGRTWPGANRTLDVHVATLRTKLGRPELVATVRGVGYRLGR